MLKKSDLFHCLIEQKKTLDKIEMVFEESSPMKIFCEVIKKKISRQEARIKRVKEITTKDIQKITNLSVIINSLAKSIIRSFKSPSSSTSQKKFRQ